MIKEKKECIRFMELKAEKIKEHCNIEYFLEADKKAIENMEDERFQKAWRQVEKYINGGDVCGLGSYTCIFCVYNNDNCDICEYGENHRVCGIPFTENDWLKIVNRIDVYNVFTNKIYQELLKISKLSGIIKFIKKRRI